MKRRTVLLTVAVLVTTTLGTVSVPAMATAAPVSGSPVMPLSLPLVQDGPVLPLGGVLTGVIQLAAQSDCYAFSGAAGDRFRVRVVETLGLLFAATRVLRPDGTELYGRNVYRESTCRLGTTGVHPLRIADDLGTALGNYSVNLQRLNDPSTAACWATARRASAPSRCLPRPTAGRSTA